jgi:hypothetical protein
LRSTVNLHILHREFASLAESAYFDNGFKQFSAKTLDAIDHVLSNLTIYPDDVIRAFEAHLWNARKFVKGSRASDTPYEVQSALRLALKQWMSADALISNAELEDISFFLNLLDLWGFIKTALIHYNTNNYDPTVVRIGAPSVYKHRPVFCIPLFHELGHFIDLTHGVSSTSMIQFQPANVLSTDIPAMQREHHHRMEHFADLFAACYCSDSLNEILVRLEGNQPASATHPATADRLSVVADFLSGRQNNIVSMFRTVLPVRGLPNLSQKFSIPNVQASFDDVRTFTIAGESEFFGFFPAAWRYLEEQLDNRRAPWIRPETNQLGIESTINDLTEKSLRNFEIKARWKDVTGP